MAQVERKELLNHVIIKLIASNNKYIHDRRDALEHIQIAHDASNGLYGFCKEHDALVDNSAAELSCQFYTAYNAEFGVRY